MTRTTCMILSAAAIVSAAWILPGCEADDSMPSRPRTANPLTPDMNAQDNADRRVREAPQRELPTSGHEFPGQSNAGAMGEAQVVTLQAGGGGGAGGGNGGGNGMGGGNGTGALGQQSTGFTGPSGWNAFGNTTGPTTVYTADFGGGPLPHLPANPGTVPMAGSTPAPDGDWVIENSWGQGLTLENYPHRPWPVTTATYQSGAVKHNPVYYFNLQEHLNVQQNDGTYGGDWISNLYEIPWFMGNTAALPILMLLEPPLAQRTTDRGSGDPIYRGHVVTEGPVVPVPTPGTLQWTYPFLRPDGSVIEPGTGQPEGTTAPATSVSPATTTPTMPTQ